MIKNRKYNYRKIWFFIFYFLFFVFSIRSFSFGEDFLEQTFQQSKDNETVVDVGSSKEDVWGKLIDGGGGLGVGIGIWSSGSLLVSTIKWLLRMAAILGVSMGIYVGIQFILSQGDQAKEKKATDNLIKIAVGIVLALWAIAIVNLIQSITRSTI